MFLTIIISVIAAVLLAGYLIVRKDLLEEDSMVSRLAMASRGEKKIEAKIRQIRYMRSPFSQTPCIACRYEIRNCSEKTIINKKGRSSKHVEWDIFSSGQKTEDFYLDQNTAKTHISATSGRIECPLTNSYILRRTGMQAKEDIINYMTEWRSGHSSSQKFLRDLERTNASDTPKEAASPEHARLYFFEHLILDNDTVSVVARAQKPRKAGHHRGGSYSVSREYMLRLVKLQKI